MDDAPTPASRDALPIRTPGKALLVAWPGSHGARPGPDQGQHGPRSPSRVHVAGVMDKAGYVKAVSDAQAIVDEAISWQLHWGNPDHTELRKIGLRTILLEILWTGPATQDGKVRNAFRDRAAIACFLRTRSCLPGTWRDNAEHHPCTRLTWRLAGCSPWRGPFR